jgi:hypothetical protein
MGQVTRIYSVMTSAVESVQGPGPLGNTPVSVPDPVAMFAARDSAQVA